MRSRSPVLAVWLSTIIQQEGAAFGSALGAISFDTAQIDSRFGPLFEKLSIEALKKCPNEIDEINIFEFPANTPFSTDFEIELLSRRASSIRGKAELANIKNMLTGRLVQIGKLNEALICSEEALSISKELYASDPIGAARLYASVLTNHSGVQQILGESDKAIESSEMALTVYVGMSVNRIPIVFDAFFGALSNHGCLLSKVRGAEDGIHFFESFLQELLVPDESQNLDSDICRALTLSNYALLLMDVNRKQDALQCVNDALEILKNRKVSDSSRTIFPFANILSTTSNILNLVGYEAQAIIKAKAAVREWRILRDARPSYFFEGMVSSLVDAARLLDGSDEMELAVEYCLEALSVIPNEEKTLARIILCFVDTACGF